jgi:predicted transcriptional regulator
VPGGGRAWHANIAEYILEYMKQLLVEIDDATAARLDRVAPSRARKRSEFVRKAILAALDRELESETAAAYARRPDGEQDDYFDPAEWESTRTRKPTR